MKLTQLTSADLKRIATILEKKEDLQAQLAQLDSQLSAYETGETVPVVRAKPGRKPGRPASTPTPVARAGRAKRGVLKAAILDLVKAAGKAGITVKDIAAKLGAKYNRVFTWFYTTGKNVRDIKKVGPATYAWAGGPLAAEKPPVPAASPATAKAASTAKPARRSKRTIGRRAKPGQFKDAVLATVRAAGKGGISVKDIASRMGLNPQRIYVWFNATGKNVKGIKKVAPATYAWAG